MSDVNATPQTREAEPVLTAAPGESGNPSASGALGTGLDASPYSTDSASNANDSTARNEPTPIEQYGAVCRCIYWRERLGCCRRR